MPDDTIVNLEELAQNLPDHPERYTELADVDISSLSFDDLETYSALLEQYATQMDPNIVDSLKARIEERVKDLEAVEAVDENAEDVVEDEPVEETEQAVAREAFNPQEALDEWLDAKEAGDEDKMEEIGQKIADALPYIYDKDIQQSSMDDVYALHDLLEDETFRYHLPMNAYLNANHIQVSLNYRIIDFELRYALYPLQDAANVEASHEKLDTIPTEDLLQDLDDETKELLNRLTVVRPLTKAISTKIKKRVDQDQPDNDIALMLERIRFETQMVVANRTTPNEDVKDVFQREFQDRLQYHIATLAGDEEIRAIVNNERRNPTEYELKDIYQKLLETKTPISVDQRTLAVWHAQSQQDTETALKRMDKQQGYKEIVQTLRGRLAEIDEKCHKKYGNWYNLAKTALKSAGWGAAYSVGAAFGPVGITAVATASFANNVYKQYKEYKKAKENNSELKSFWVYLKNNKMALASLELGLFSTVTAAAGFSGDAAVKAAKMAAGTFLGLAGALKASTKAFKETEGSRFDKTKAALKTFGSSAAGFVVGMLAGRAAGSALNTDTHIPAENNLADVSEPIHDIPVNEAPVNEAPVNDAPVNDAPVNEAPVNDAPVNDAPTTDTPDIDLDNLTSQQQHDLDMLFKRAPTEAYDVLDKTGYEGDWMNSRELAEAYDSLTDAQKTALVQYAGERFDDQGYFQDVEGHSSAAQMEAEAREYSLSQAQESPEQNTSDENQEQTSIQDQQEEKASDQNQETDQTLPESDVHTTKEGVRYSFDENNITINGSVKGLDVQSLCPENNGDTASKILEARIKSTALQDIVYSDLLERAQVGEALNPQEQAFISHHEQQLEKYGLTHDESGKLVRVPATEAEPVQQTQSPEEKVVTDYIDKVKVRGDDIKVVGHDAEGHRVVEHFENRDGFRDGKFKVNDDQTKVVYHNPGGRDVYKLDQDGHGTVTKVTHEDGRVKSEIDSRTAQEMNRIRSILHPEPKEETPAPSANTSSTFHSDRGGR